jgi:hypothetical protein
MANGFVVEKDDWEKMDQQAREWLTFNAVQDMNKRLTALENKRWVDKTCAFAGGIIGGVCAYFGGKAV